MRTGVVVFIVLCWITGVSEASKAKDVKEGNKLFEEGQFEQSLEKYEKALEQDPQSDIIHFNTGAALYKKNNFDRAIEHFRKALLGDSATLKQRVYYNLGNSFFKQGLGREKIDLPSAIQSLEESLREYEKVLVHEPEEEDTRYNYDIVKSELERLKEKVQQQQQQNQQQQNQQNNQQQNDEKQEQQDSQSDQSQQDQQDEQDHSGQQNDQQSQEDQRQGDFQKQDRIQQNQSGAEQQGSTSGMNENRELTEREAQMMLENYQQNEEPKHPLNFSLRKLGMQEVEKDW